MVNKDDNILHKITRRKDIAMTMISIRRISLSVIPSQVVNVFDLGYLGVEKDYPARQLSALPCKEKRNQDELFQKEKEYNKNHCKKIKCKLN